MFYDLDMSYVQAAVRRVAAVAAEPRPPVEARLVAEVAAQGQEGCAAPGEARGGEDAPAQTDLPASDAGQHDERLQPQDLQFSSVHFSRSIVSDSLRPHESQHARPPCPSPTPGVHGDSRPLSQ